MGKITLAKGQAGIPGPIAGDDFTGPVEALGLEACEGGLLDELSGTAAVFPQGQAIPDTSSR